MTRVVIIALTALALSAGVATISFETRVRKW